MAIFYQPDDGVAADFIPFHWQGEYHLFYLKDYRDRAGHGEGTPWFHLGTRDFVHFTEYGEALPRGTVDEQDLYVFTGCVIERDGVFHIFYTGHNPHFRAAGKPEQAVMHATSSDLVTWTKDPDNPILFADGDRYEPHDWRDPFVFWNAEAGEYWMLLAAREKEGPSNRRGCIALATSPDSVSWSIQEPFWAPKLYFTHECPDLFQLGGRYYLVYSTFSERTVTHYRTSTAVEGPWAAPADDAFDTRAFYAAKTAGDGERHFIFGWNPTREGDRDTGRWQWGGTLEVHELTLRGDGSLRASAPLEILAAYTRSESGLVEPRMGDRTHAESGVSVSAPASFGWSRVAACEAESLFEVSVTVEPGTQAAGILLKADPELENYYQVRIEPARNRVVFDRWPRPGDEPFMLERPVQIATETPVKLQIFRQNTMILVYINGEIALSARAYNPVEGDWGLFVNEGVASFSEIQVLQPRLG